MATTATTPITSTWSIDSAHSSADFKVKHMMISNVKGRFSGITGSLIRNEADHTRSIIAASVPIATISTGDPQRDGHLKSAEFFDAEKFPTMDFKSIAIHKNADDEFEVSGELSIHGVTKMVTFRVEGPSEPAKDPWGNTRIGLSATTKINRKDFGLNWNSALEAGGVLVGDEIAITLDIEFIKA